MTIPKSKKRRKGGKKISLSQKNLPAPPADKMVRNYPRYCEYCDVGSYSAMCGCGRITVINKGG